MRKARVSKSWSKHNLPDELWPEILLRLPAKSLLRFRCVSRSWKTWIDDPDFTRLHLTCFNNRPDSPILFVQSGSSSECVVKNSETLRTISSLGFLQSDLESVHVLRTTHARLNVNVKRWSIVSSIDGLFLLQCEYWSRLMLWNPSIRKTLTLPPPPVIRIPGNLGIGFDPSVRDYKVVIFSFRRNEPVPVAGVYTLKTNSWRWKVINSHGGRWIDEFKHSPISFNGVLYSLTTSRKLLSFDLRSEVFDFFELPVNKVKWSRYKLTIVDNGSSLALVHVYKFKGSIWTLESLGDDTKPVSWIQRYTFDSVAPQELCEYEFLCMKKNGEMLMRWYCKVICYNLETHHQKILMEKNRKRFEVDITVPYMESLILLS